MSLHRFLRQIFLVLCLSVMVAASVYAQAPAGKEEYQPSVGQAGKDVIWVPTSQALADKMLSLAQVTARDYVIDLGSGDGRFVITAAKRGARALGIEYNPDLVELSQRTAAREGVAEKARFVKADLFESDFSQATVITMFLLPDINLRLRPLILDLKPGTRIVSNSFDMGDWTADETIKLGREEGCDNNYCQAYFWIVPAKVEGTWKLPQGDLKLKQTYQMVSGELASGKDRIAITDGRLSGSKISFKIGDASYTGTVVGTTMQGTVRAGGNSSPWSANRSGK
ncbi:MAG: class I SAM-dependent methyltransferase [Thermodesulfobacteriota bacterium]